MQRENMGHIFVRRMSEFTVRFSFQQNTHTHSHTEHGNI